MCLQGIVNILSAEGKSFGTGFFVSPKGYILTCLHVLSRAGYQRIGQAVSFKYADDTSLYQAKWIKRDKKADLAILCASIAQPSYIPMCKQDVSGRWAECYGFPNNSYTDISAHVSIDRFCDHENLIQLGNANAVTLGFSGGPVIYNGTAIGMVLSIPKTVPNGRMSQIAMAISAKLVLNLHSEYISEKELCIGYGEKRKKCANYVAAKDTAAKALGLCEECYTQKFTDDIQALYKAQNYRIHCIHKDKQFFVTELKYGASTYFDAVFTFVKFGDTIKPDDLYPLPHRVRSSGYTTTRTVIVSNVQSDKSCNEIIKEEGLTFKTKEQLLRDLFDFESYRDDLISHVHSEQLSTHYIEVYSTTDFPKEENITFKALDDEDLYADDCYFYSDNEEEDGCGEEYDYREKDGYEEENGLDLYRRPACRKRTLLKDYVTAFLESDHQALLILGDYGSGKTSFCYTYTLEMLNQFMQNQSASLPLLIKLRGYNKAVGLSQVLTDYFVNDLGVSNFNIGAFKLLLKNINVILIFDGYDEVAKKVDFDIKYEVLREICDLAEERTKVIVTCRPNYFQNASEFANIFKKSYFQYEPGDKPLLEFVENSIADLDESQIDAYIDSYQIDFARSNITKRELLETIANTHDLSDLAKRPFLLYMIMSTLPKILKETKGKQKAKINAAMLYQVYTDNWLRREDQKNKTLIKRKDKELFCKELALELYTSNEISLSYRDLPEAIKRNFKHVGQTEDVDYFSHDIQSCSFLTSDRSGEFKFIHKSFMEYFVAERVVSKLDEYFVKTSNMDKRVKKINQILGNIPFSMEICLFISDILSATKRNLIQEVRKLSDSLNSTSAANMLSIISKTGCNMVECLLPYIRSTEKLCHVDFGHAIFFGGLINNLSFQNAQFYSASLKGTIFVECDFRGAVFSKATLEDVKFYKCQFTSSKWRDSKLNGCVFSPSDLDEDDLMTCFDIIPCDFENSTWHKSTIESCSFYDCLLVDNHMKMIKIHDTTFEYVDFSGTYIEHVESSNNQMYNVTGEPYEL